jgi:dimethylhistidine N-methyltransferase
MTSARQPAPAPAPRNLAEIDLAPRTTSLRAEALEGLSRPNKSLPPKLFYDARGATLFTRICATQAYYPTRTEIGILQRSASEIARQIGPYASLLEPGAGDMRKIRILLPAVRPSAYLPIDISIEQLRIEARQLAIEFPWLAVTAVCADFHAAALDSLLEQQRGRRVLFFPGSTIGNFEPVQAQAFLHRAHGLLGAAGAVLLGVDLEKPKAILDLAYNDPQGYTAQFNLNLLVRLNRELSAQFNLSDFAHRAYYNEAARRVEMHLVSRRPQTVRVASQLVHFAADETIHTENSYKYTSEQVQQMARAAGFEAVRAWHDPLGWFGVFLLSAESAGNAR